MATRRHVGLYPGTFDPITNGHTDIITRGANLVDHLIIGVAQNSAKNPLFSIEERLAQVSTEVSDLDMGETTWEVIPFDSLLMHFAEDVGAQAIIRGLRVITDFDYEFQMAGMNSRLNANIQTVFLMASEGVHFISSRYVKEIGRLGGDISSYVSPHIRNVILSRFELPVS